eukprot:1652406-Alexandrium_andersonii.AAC.1
MVAPAAACWPRACITHCSVCAPMVLVMCSAGRTSGCVGLCDPSPQTVRQALRHPWLRRTTQRCTVAPAAALEPPGLQIGCPSG